MHFLLGIKHWLKNALDLKAIAYESLREIKNIKQLEASFKRPQKIRLAIILTVGMCHQRGFSGTRLRKQGLGVGRAIVFAAFGIHRYSSMINQGNANLVGRPKKYAGRNPEMSRWSKESSETPFGCQNSQGKGEHKMRERVKIRFMVASRQPVR